MILMKDFVHRKCDKFLTEKMFFTELVLRDKSALFLSFSHCQCFHPRKTCLDCG
jgi:hypothetical protein